MMRTFSLATLMTLSVMFVEIAVARADEAAGTKLIDIGSRLELFVDEYLLDKKTGVTRELHSPQPKGVVFTFDRPWEGGATGCVTVFDDGIPGGTPHYRMYYVGTPMRGKYSDFPNIYGPAVVCMAESRDGIEWTRPNLKLFTGDFVDRYKKPFKVPMPNNIVWIGQGMQVHSNDNFVPFKDTNPRCKPEDRYKAVGRWMNLPDPAPPKRDESGYPWPPGAGLVALQSADGIRWSLMQEDRIINDSPATKKGVGVRDPGKIPQR